jgi:hypothetical protein
MGWVYRPAVNELSLTVVGIDHPNADRSNRMFELLQCVRPEPKNPFDEHAVAVFSARGRQIGYLRSERAVMIGARLRAGEEYVALFQDLDTHAAHVRVRFGGGVPTLPVERGDHDPRADLGGDFQPDPEGPEWGA